MTTDLRVLSLSPVSAVYRQAPRRRDRGRARCPPVHGTGALYSNEAAVRTGEIGGVHICTVARVVVGPQHTGVRAAHGDPGALFHPRLCNVPVRATLGMLWSVTRRRITAPKEIGLLGLGKG